MNWKKIRKQFRAFDKSIYANTAATGLIPDRTLELMNRLYREHALRGADAAEEWVPKMEGVRSKVARLINADDYEIAIVPNMATALNWLAMMFKPAGYDFGCVDGDFPSLISPWEIHGYPIKKINAKKDGSFSYGNLKKLNTGIIAVSHVQWHTGFKLDLKKLKKVKSNNNILLLDATQSLGTCKIDVRKSDVDIMVASCYKWMMCGFGNCIVYVKKELLEKFPSMYCWQFRAELEGYPAFPSAKRFEIGHERHDAFFRLGASLDLINEIGISNIEKRINQLKDYFYKEAKRNGIEFIFPYGKEFRSQIIIVGGDFKTQKKLEKKNIYTSFRGTGLRISLHFYNTKKDIDYLISELSKLKN